MTMISRRSVLLGAVGSTIPQIRFVDARKPGSGTGTGTITSTGSTSGMVFSPVSIGGGGYITGIQMMSDGTMLVHNDSGQGYIRSNAAAGSDTWRPMLTYANTPLNGTVWGWSNGENGGTWNPHNAGLSADIYEIQLAPSDHQVIYALWMGYMIVSQDQGNTWTVMSNFPAVNYQQDANAGNQRFNQKKMRVDPDNANRVIIATPANGVYMTSNGLNGATATFMSLSGNIPTPGSRNYICGIDYDATSGTTGGFTNRIAVGVGGRGVYISTDAGSTWALSSGSPAVLVSDGLFANGNYYLANITDGNVYMLHSGTWYNLGGGGFYSIAIDPNDPNHIAGMWSGGAGGGALNQGIISGTTATWYGPYGNYNNEGVNPAPASDCPWTVQIAQQWTGYYWAGAGCAFDPVNAGSGAGGRLWATYGYGVMYVDIASKTMTDGPGTLVGFSTIQKGIENTDGNFIVSIPGYPYPLMAVDDLQVFQIVDPTTPPPADTPKIGSRQQNASCWSIDWSQSSLGVVAALCSGYYVGAPNKSGYSTNGGASWALFPNPPFTFDGGMITCTDASHFVAVRTGRYPPVYTNNGGSTWNTCVGAPTAVYQGYMFNRATTFCNDAGGNIYIYQYQNGLYKSTNGGANFSLVNRRAVCINNFAAKLRAVPGHAGHLFITTGFSFAGSYPSGNGLYYSTNGGTTWNKVANVLDAWCIGFGQAYPGYTYPTLWIYGFVNKGGAGYKWGLWRSRDLGVSDWTRICYWDGGHCVPPVDVFGDMNDYTKVYISYTGNGFRYGRNIT